MIFILSTYDGRCTGKEHVLHKGSRKLIQTVEGVRVCRAGKA